MNKKNDKITIRCKHCNNRMFDYVAGDMILEMKCSRCKKTIGIMRFTEGLIKSNATNGEYRV